jgi:hypothetical protein
MLLLGRLTLGVHGIKEVQYTITNWSRVIDWVNDYIFHGSSDLTNVLLYSDEADMGRHGCFDLLCMVWLI